MKKTILSAALVAVMGVVAFAPQNAKASDGTITFKGNITAQTCTISVNGGAATVTVQLPTVSTAALPAGQVAGATAFPIALSNCSPNSGNVSTYFEAGSTIDLATGNLLNVNGTATNVEVGLLNAKDSTAIKLGNAQATQNSLSVAIASGAATLNYIAQYVATNGASTVGTVDTSVTYSMSYQ